MNFSEFESIVSVERMHRYLLSTSNNCRKAETLYRYNINASLAMFAVIGSFEIALRNAIDKEMTEKFGRNWLRDAIMPGGIFDIPKCRDHARIIRFAYEKLTQRGCYSHSNLLSKMEFGIWKYMFSTPQYSASGRILLNIFPNKPKSNRTMQYNNTFVFNELDHLNSLRNRLAHHEPICFPTGFAEISTSYIHTTYEKIIKLFDWMGIDSDSYLFGIDHVKQVCENLERLK